jgi:hypothetical protein
MALTRKPRGRWWSRLHALVRFLGLTGLLAAGVGLGMALLDDLLPSWEAARATAEETVRGVIEGRPGDLALRITVGLVLGGALAALLALLVEVAVVLRLAAGRRSAFGGNVLLQVALAAALLVGVNLYANREGNYRRFDLTRDRQFTLPADVQGQLRRLQAETKIVVYQRHKTFGWLADKPDRFDYAAERKVVEKVKDLVEQFAAVGKQFDVRVLDVEQDDFDSELARLPEALRKAIDQAPENSIFFYAGDRVQRLSFNDFYQLDKTASEEADGGRGNLVLRSQGVRPFARKVLDVDEKRPRVAVAVIHPVLSTEGSEELGMAGVKKALAAHGFEARDLILKKWNEFTPPEPAALTFEENKLAQLDEEVKGLEEDIKAREEDLQALGKHVKQWKTAPLNELAKTDLAKELGLEGVSESVRKQVLERVLEPSVGLHQLLNEQARKELEGLRKEREGVARAEDSLAEQRRNSDVRSKTARVLDDADLLILPRMTLFNAARGERIPSGLYRLDPAQVEAVRDFVRAGKPVLLCLGPANEPPGRPDPDAGPDALEDLLRQLGLRLGGQTVLFNVEGKAYAQQRGGLVIPGTNVEVPPLRFDWPPGTGVPTARAVTGEDNRVNPLRQSLRLTARALGKGQALDLRLRNPRPVYYDPVAPRLPLALGAWAVAPDAGLPAGLPWGGLFLADRPTRAAGFPPEFLMTDAESWNEGQPFATRERPTPRYEPPKPDQAAADPYEKKRLGPFPVGVAAEVTDWYATRSAEPPTARVVVIGHGGVFLGPTLSPAREKLLLDSCNWLLGRDELLTREGTPWHYPRVALDARAHALWQWGPLLGLPVLFGYLGLVVVLVRRMR